MRQSTGLLNAGWAFCVVGLLLALYFFLFYATGVEGVENIGLLTRKISGVVVGMGLALLGGLLIASHSLVQGSGHAHRAVILLTVLANKQGATEQDIKNVLG